LVLTPDEIDQRRKGADLLHNDAQIAADASASASSLSGDGVNPTLKRIVIGLTGLLLLAYIGAEVTEGAYISTYVQLTELMDEGGMYMNIHFSNNNMRDSSLTMFLS